MTDDRTAWLTELDMESRRIDRIIRALTPVSLTYKAADINHTVADIVALIIRSAEVMKEILDKEEVNVNMLAAPSFTSPEEAADILKSAFAFVRAAVSELSPEAWLAPVRLIGETKDRGQNRGPELVSILRDIAARASELDGIEMPETPAPAVPEVKTSPGEEEAAK